jgi:hypothetical protein
MQIISCGLADRAIKQPIPCCFFCELDAVLGCNIDSVELCRDSKGFQTIIGSADLVTPPTGETRQTSAASIRMFNDKGDVIWAAPSS